jgi:hypothetical protein
MLESKRLSSSEYITLAYTELMRSWLILGFEISCTFEYSASNGRMTCAIGRELEITGRDVIEEISPNLPGDSGQNRKIISV